MGSFRFSWFDSKHTYDSDLDVEIDKIVLFRLTQWANELESKNEICVLYST